MQEDGEYVPAFPNATYYVQKGEWNDAEHADGQTVNGYRYDEVMRPLSPVLALLERDERICPLIEVVVTPGHTRRHQSVLVHTGEDTFCFVWGSDSHDASSEADLCDGLRSVSAADLSG